MAKGFARKVSEACWTFGRRDLGSDPYAKAKWAPRVTVGS